MDDISVQDTHVHVAMYIPFNNSAVHCSLSVHVHAYITNEYISLKVKNAFLYMHH